MFRRGSRVSPLADDDHLAVRNRTGFQNTDKNRAGNIHFFGASRTVIQTATGRLRRTWLDSPTDAVKKEVIRAADIIVLAGSETSGRKVIRNLIRKGWLSRLVGGKYLLLPADRECGLMEHLAFKGGTMLRKMVFGPRGRLSTDLDFTCRAEMPIDDLTRMLLDARRA